MNFHITVHVKTCLWSVIDTMNFLCLNLNLSIRHFLSHGQQALSGLIDTSFCGNTLHLLFRDPKVFWDQVGYVNPPWSSGSISRVCSQLDIPRESQKKVCPRPGFSLHVIDHGKYIYLHTYTYHKNDNLNVAALHSLIITITTSLSGQSRSTIITYCHKLAPVSRSTGWWFLWPMIQHVCFCL